MPADLARMEYFLKDLENIDKIMLKDLKRFFFGIDIQNKIDYHGSTFERILATSRSSSLIKLIWSKLEFLGRSEEILVLVRILLKFQIKVINENSLLEKLSRKNLPRLRD